MAQPSGVPCKVCIGDLQRRAQAQDGLGHLVVAMEGRPVQRRGLVLPPGVHGPATLEHEPNDVGLIVARRVRHQSAVGFVKTVDDVRMRVPNRQR